jgi:type IV secretory pathway TrbD component
MADLQTRQLTINASMTKPLLILGCDRTLIAVSSLFCVYVGFNIGLAQGKFDIMLMAIAAWIVIRFGLVQMGKRDPLMLGVFTRSLLYSDKMFRTQYFIPANSSIEVRVPKFKKKRWLTSGSFCK